MKNIILKKIIPLSLCVAIFFGIAALAVPQKAHATAVVDAGNITQSTITAINTTSSSYSNMSLQLKAFVLDTLATTLVKQLIRKITADVVNWINTGFEGSPAFVTNPGGFLIDVADQVSGAFLEKAGGPLASLCSAFSIDIRLALSFKYHPYVGKKYECTIGKIIANSKNAIKGATINGFAAGDFRQGGWPAFVSMTTEPQNNVYGAFLEADSELSVRVANMQIGKKEEINNGKGFLSWRNPKCTSGVKRNNAAVRKQYIDDVGGNVQTPRESQNPGIPNPNSSSDRSNVASSIDAFSMAAAAGDAAPDSYQLGVTTGSYDQAVSQNQLNEKISPLYGGDTTIPKMKSAEDCPIETPGSLIVSNLETSVNGPLHELELVDSINEIINALAAALVNKVLQEGLAAASGSSPSDSTAYINQIQAEAKAQEVTGAKNDFLQNIDRFMTNTRQYKENKEQSRDVMLGVKTKYEKVNACYSQKITATPQTLTPTQIAEAQRKLAETNNVVSTTVGPLLPSLVAGADSANTRYQTLNSLQQQALTAQTANDLNAPSTAYSQMLQSQSLTTAKDVVDSQTELDATKLRAEPMIQDANTRDIECQAFPFGTGRTTP